MDRFLPMPDIGVLTRDTWGADNVVPRYTDNGIENRKWSFWGGNIKLGEDGKYHFYVCGWLESSPKGHNEWPNSIVFNAVSDISFGPFVVKDTIGKGHNPEIFKLKDGRYVLYVIDGYYIADGTNGSWKYGKFEFLNRDRRLIEGNSNFTFSQREDGSYLMICRGGGQWFSQTALTAYNQVTGTRIDSAKKIIPLRAYPQRPGNFEDPVVWRDNVQYNLIVNDWLGRIAVYERSKDGVNWKVESGEAYLPGVSIHEDGTVEGWWKYERLKIFQDKYGRAIQGNFAVIDVEKKFDKASDNHRSKNIGIPLTAGRLLTILDKKTLTGQNGLYASAVFDQNSNEIILKLVNSTDKAQTANVVLESAKKLGTKGKMIVLKSDNPDQVNSLDQPTLVSPVEQELTIKGKAVDQILEPYSFSVVRIKVL